MVYDIVFYVRGLCRGGSELALLRYLKNNKKDGYNIVLAYGDGQVDSDMINEFKHYIDVIKIDVNSDIHTKVAVNCQVSRKPQIFNSIIAEKRIYWVQANPQKYGADYLGFEKYDSYLVTSNYIKNLVKISDKSKGKSIYIANPIVDSNEILKLSKESESILNQDFKSIYTVARVCPEKGITEIIEVCRLLKDRCLNFKWYILGFVPEDRDDYYNGLLKLIGEYDLKDNIVFCGVHKNPYKYLKNAYINVLLSEDESWGLGITEGKVLGIPAIVSNNSALREQITDGENGFLVDFPKKEEDFKIIADRIEQLFKDEELYEKMKRNLSLYSIDVEKIVNTMNECFYQFLK